jgi:hypothetical protein
MARFTAWNRRSERKVGVLEAKTSRWGKGHVDQGRRRHTWGKRTGVREAAEMCVAKDHTDLGRR